MVLRDILPAEVAPGFGIARSLLPTGVTVVTVQAFWEPAPFDVVVAVQSRLDHEL